VFTSNKPLSGFRILELSAYVAAPSCGRLFADWGADVIKVEAPSGDVFRQFGTILKTPISEEENPIWDIIHANKRAIALDLKNDRGKEIFHKLLAKADVFLTNNRPAALKKLGLDYETLAEAYPRLIYAIITGFGESGPDAHLPGFDVAAYWARSGFSVDLVRPDEYPVYPPSAFGDITVGTALFGGICAALLNREKTGKGDKISIALFGASIWFSSFLMLCTQERYGNIYPKTRMEGNPVSIPYKCKDNEWVTTSVLDHAQWPIFCKAVNLEDLIHDPRFEDREEWLNHKEELIRILEPIFASKDREEWVQIFKNAGIVVEKLNHFKDVCKDPQAWANDFVFKNTFANGEEAVMPCTPLQTARAELMPFNRAPHLGEHSQEILEELGYSADEIDEMKREKITVAR